MALNKKGQGLSIGNNLLLLGVMILLIAGFIATLGANVSKSLGDSVVSDAIARNGITASCNTTIGIYGGCGGITYNTTIDNQNGIKAVSDQFDLSGTIIVMVFLLGLIFLAVAVFQNR